MIFLKLEQVLLLIGYHFFYSCERVRSRSDTARRNFMFIIVRGLKVAACKVKYVAAIKVVKLFCFKRLLIFFV